MADCVTESRLATENFAAVVGTVLEFGVASHCISRLCHGTLDFDTVAHGLFAVMVVILTATRLRCGGVRCLRMLGPIPEQTSCQVG